MVKRVARAGPDITGECGQQVTIAGGVSGAVEGLNRLSAIPVDGKVPSGRCFVAAERALQRAPGGAEESLRKFQRLLAQWSVAPVTSRSFKASWAR